ncbi:unnamed protein product [Rotaria socialis]|uniref:Uncharacterized protein n=1 Tax=Rotaria socialis TaxID=392032 RepID=A0A820W667_9BILA|nr:unnamed protein product [Rotaria socialis]
MVVAGGAAYGNNNNNTDARNAIFAGAVFLGLGVLCCLSAIIHTCANCSDHRHSHASCGITVLVHEADALRQQNSSLCQQLKALQFQIQRQQIIFDQQLHKSVSTQPTIPNKSTGQAHDFKEEINNLKEENSNLNEQDDQLKKEINTLEQANDAMKENINNLKQENSDLKQEFRRLQQENSRLEQEYRRFEQESRILRQEIDRCIEENNRLKNS